MTTKEHGSFVSPSSLGMSVCTNHRVETNHFSQSVSTHALACARWKDAKDIAISSSVHVFQGSAQLAITAWTWIGWRVAACRERLFGRRHPPLRKDARVAPDLEASTIPVARSFKYGPKNGPR
jgi:hypothetical protein